MGYSDSLNLSSLCCLEAAGACVCCTYPSLFHDKALSCAQSFPGCFAPSLSSAGWSQAFFTCPNHPFIYSSFGGLARGLECSTHASMVLASQPFPSLCRSAISFLQLPRTTLLACSVPSHSPKASTKMRFLLIFFPFGLDTFSVLTKGKLLAESLTRCINCTEDAQRKSSQNLSECCRKAYFLVNLFLEVIELFWLKFPV